MANNRHCIYKSKYGDLCIEHLYTVQINTTFNVYVKSYGFSGSYDFCMLNEDVEKYIEKLNIIYKELNGEVTFSDNDSDSTITFEFEKQRIKVYGQLGGSYNENFIKFGFDADQTIIKLLINVLYEGLRE